MGKFPQEVMLLCCSEETNMLRCDAAGQQRLKKPSDSKVSGFLLTLHLSLHAQSGLHLPQPSIPLSGSGDA